MQGILNVVFEKQKKVFLGKEQLKAKTTKGLSFVKSFITNLSAISPQCPDISKSHTILATGAHAHRTTRSLSDPVWGEHLAGVGHRVGSGQGRGWSPIFENLLLMKRGTERAGLERTVPPTPTSRTDGRW